MRQSVLWAIDHAGQTRTATLIDGGAARMLASRNFTVTPVLGCTRGLPYAIGTQVIDGMAIGY